MTASDNPQISKTTSSAEGFEQSSDAFWLSDLWRERILKLTVNGLLFNALLALSISRDFYDSTMSSAYLALALFSGLIVLGMIRRAWMDLLWVTAGTLLLYVLDYRVMHFNHVFMAGFSFAGLSSLAVLGTRTVWAEGEERRDLLYGFVPVLLFITSEWFATTLLDFTEWLHPKTFDLFLYSFDASLGVPTSFLIGRGFWTIPYLRTTSMLFYIALPLPLALVYAGHVRRQKSMAVSTMAAFLFTGPVGVILYNILPACGPVHIFGAAFPFHPPAMADVMRMQVVPILMKGARNAIPSLHMTWVLLIWYNSRKLPRWIRSIAMAFVVFTFLATLGSGEHYFVDLVVAFPFSLMMQAISSFSLPFRSRERRIAILFGAALTLTWVGLLSFANKLFWISPIIPWAMVAATVSSSLVLWQRLLRVSFSDNSVDAKALPARAMVAGAGA